MTTSGAIATTVPHVYACIAAVSAEIALTGIAKSRNNAQQGYKFRGIDDVYNAIAPLLAKHGLVIIPRILSRAVVERQAKSGGILNYVTVEAEFDFVSAKDGSKVTARSFGEAMDSADKGTNKAMSAAYKYTAFQTFCIPTEGDNDADAHTPDAVARANAPTIVALSKPEGYDAWNATLTTKAEEGFDAIAAFYKVRSPEKDAYRAYLTATEPQRIEGLKAAAKAVDDVKRAKAMKVPA